METELILGLATIGVIGMGFHTENRNRTGRQISLSIRQGKII